MSPLHEQTVLIVGLGESGLAMARWCQRLGARVWVADTRDAPPQLAALQAELPQAQFCAAPLDAALLARSGARAVFKSPGLSPAQVAPLLEAARAQAIPVAGEWQLFAQGLAELHGTRGYQPVLLAVTGTNGKTTVTALTTQLVERAGRSVVAAGNIGPTLLDTLARCLDADALPEVWVLELSSFQLDGVTDFQARAATVLNISQDHLDWHGSLGAYAAAKAHIFGRTDASSPPAPLMLLNRDDPLVMALPAMPGKGRTRLSMRFGSDLPTQAGDWGLETVHGITWLVRALPAEDGGRRRKDGAPASVRLQRLMPANALRIRGRHNALNALAALALATAADCALAPMLYGLREYRGEPHRVEPVAVVDEVEYFDDSKGTNVGATVAALEGLGAERRLVVILGGDGKGQDFAPLAAPLARYARAALLIGRDAPALRAVLQASVSLHDAASLPDAVALAARLAQPGDAVLLSPACASLDMFRNYAHRAQVFIAAVQALSEGAQAHSVLESP